MKRVFFLLTALLLTVSLVGCGSGSAEAPDWSGLQSTGSMELEYAQQFTVEDYEGGYSLVTIGGEDQFLVVPEGKEVPSGLPEKIVPLRLPLERFYVASSGAVDLFQPIDELDSVKMVSTKAEDWRIDTIQQAVENGDITYVGKYSAPDYELVLEESCDLVVENTMIYHSPETKEQLESLGLPVLVERSGRESHPLGRMEWVKLYGLLTGKREEAEAFFTEQTEQLENVLTGESTGKTVAFFYITDNGVANVRKPGDYISKMIELAGGEYVFSDLADTDENALSTMNMELESFYEGACDADILIYSATVPGQLSSLDELLGKWELLADFKAVKSGDVWCTEQNMYQQTTGAAEMIQDLNAIVTGAAADTDQLTFLHRLR